MDKKSVIRIGYGGFGSEAEIFVELRKLFPGIGGTIVTQQAVAVALREEFSKEFKKGHKMFLRHTIIKKLEDYFQRKGTYGFSHIPRPLGSISRTGNDPYEAYIYEWAVGCDGFSWGYSDVDSGFVFVKMHDWSEFGAAFDRAGIDLTLDCTSADDGRVSQNVVHQFYNSYGNSEDSELNPLWKRIDFGPRSIRINEEKLARFLHDEEEDLRQVLRSERYEMMILALEYLTNFQNMDRLDIGRLDALVGSYRLSSLQHHISRGTGTVDRSVVHIESRDQSLI